MHLGPLSSWRVSLVFTCIWLCALSFVWVSSVSGLRDHVWLHPHTHLQLVCVCVSASVEVLLMLYIWPSFGGGIHHGGGLLLVALAITCSSLDACLCCVGGVCPRLNCAVTYMWLHPHNWCGFIDTTHLCLVMVAMLVVGSGECQGGLCCVVCGMSTTLLYRDIHTSTQLVWLHWHHSLVSMMDAMLVFGGGGCQAWSFACTKCTWRFSVSFCEIFTSGLCLLVYGRVKWSPNFDGWQRSPSHIWYGCPHINQSWWWCLHITICHLTSRLLVWGVEIV